MIYLTTKVGRKKNAIKMGLSVPRVETSPNTILPVSPGNVLGAEPDDSHFP